MKLNDNLNAGYIQSLSGENLLLNIKPYTFYSGTLSSRDVNGNFTISSNFDYVGDNFTREARNMHYDDKKSRGIYGKASSAEVKELVEEGIEISSIPWIDKKEH